MLKFEYSYVVSPLVPPWARFVEKLLEAEASPEFKYGFAGPPLYGYEWEKFVTCLLQKDCLKVIKKQKLRKDGGDVAKGTLFDSQSSQV